MIAANTIPANGEKVPLGLSHGEQQEWFAADKLRRYDLEIDQDQTFCKEGIYSRLAVKFTPHRSPTGRVMGEPHVVILYNPHQVEFSSRFDGPPWKLHHKDHYVRAAVLWMQGQGLLPEAAPLAPPPALPPRGPACPRCNQPLCYDTSYVGGRGYCWRHICTEQCGYFDRWKS